LSRATHYGPQPSDRLHRLAHVGFHEPIPSRIARVRLAYAGQTYPLKDNR